VGEVIHRPKGETIMRREKMRKPGRLFIALGAAAAVAVAVPAIGLAGPPVVTQNPGSLCGIDGTWVNRIVNDSSNQLPSGGEIGHFHGSFTFTSAATGKAIELISTGMNKFDPTPVDNGDGTYSLVSIHSGSGLVLKVPNGGLLTTNSGAGHFIVEDVFKIPAGGLAAANPDTDEYITTRETRVGGRTVSNGDDFCADLAIPALT
jgi:hypothetical protein